VDKQMQRGLYASAVVPFAGVCDVKNCYFQRKNVENACQNRFSAV
jgi:hypothetical protein